MPLDYTTDELICTCIARQVQDGDILAQGINTPLVMAGYILGGLYPGEVNPCARRLFHLRDWAEHVPGLGTARRGPRRRPMARQGTDPLGL